MSLGMEEGLAPGHIVLDGDPAPWRTETGTSAMSVVAKQSPISVTAELLFLNDSLLLSSLVANIHYTTCRR